MFGHMAEHPHAEAGDRGERRLAMELYFSQLMVGGTGNGPSLLQWMIGGFGN